MSFEEVKRAVLQFDRIGAEVPPQSEAARLACLDVAYSAFALVDFGRASAALDLYSKNIVMDIEGERLDRKAREERSRKREADKSRKTRHVVSNFLFRQVDERTAYALSLVTIFFEDASGVRGATPAVVADCADRYERSADGKWRIAYRYLQPVAGAAR